MKSLLLCPAGKGVLKSRAVAQGELERNRVPIVNLNLKNPDTSYQIFIESDLLPAVGSHLCDIMQPSKATVLTDSRVARLYLDVLLSSLTDAGFDCATVVLPPGEAQKSLESARHLYDRMLDHGCDRSSVVAALGGGVIGDLAGFVAATYMRGVALVQVPTSVVAQVDSSIGGKTAVDLPRGKNLVGAFHHPSAVFADVSTLATLPREEFAAGMAEAVKSGVILDAELFAFLEKELDDILAADREALVHVVTRCCELKADVVTKDPMEKTGWRAVLNYGHTVGHALEALSGYRGYRHGEAVSIGMVVAARLAEAVGIGTKESRERQTRLLARLGLPVEMPDIDVQQLVEHMAYDKKSRGGKPSFVLCPDIGKVEMSVQVPDDVILKVLQARP